MNPDCANEEEARAALLAVVRRDPRVLGYERSRWRLEDLIAHCGWLNLTTCAGMHQLLDRLHIRYTRGRTYVHSPDPFYEAKEAHLKTVIAQVQAADQSVLLFQDELTYYQMPSLARVYAGSGDPQPRAELPYDYGASRRVVGLLNGLSGQVHFEQRSKIGVQELGDFYASVCDYYSEAETIYIVQDNAPFHFHPNLLARLQPQSFQWPLALPPTWPTDPDPDARPDDLPIQLVRLPTYASWLNPIEKLWRWLKQDVLHMHRYAHDWPALQQVVHQFLSRFDGASPDLLRYVGLLPD